MSIREVALETIRDLPADASWEDVEERIRFVAAVERGIEDARNGKVHPHEEVRQLLSEWTVG